MRQPGQRNAVGALGAIACGLGAIACALVLLCAPGAGAQSGSTTAPTDSPASTSPPVSIDAGNGAVITSDSPTVSAEPVAVTPDDSSTTTILAVVAISLLVVAATGTVMTLRRRSSPSQE